MLGNAELLMTRLSGNERTYKLAQMTARAAERGAELINRLLAFARRQPLNPVATDLSHQLEGMRDLLDRTLGEHIEIEIIVDSRDLWHVMIDSTQLESAILNLCINARDAMSAGGRLTIECANTVFDEEYAGRQEEVSPGDYVMLAVSDTGSGMDAATLERVFEPFFTTKAVGKGSGLGLSMVYGFVKQSRGHIRVYSEVGYGTTVRLYLPHAESGDAPQVGSHVSESMPTGNERILVVEDDPMVREYVVMQLAGLGYQVAAVADGHEALAAIRQDDFDLLFTDIVMPGGLSGRQVADEARRIRPMLPVLFTSGYTEDAIVHQGRLEPGVHLLAKPYRRQDLATKVRLVLDSERH